MHQTSQAKPYIALGLSVIILGLNWPAMKLGLSYVTPFWMVVLRFCLSAPVIAGLILISERRLPQLHRHDIGVICGVAFFQFAGQIGLVTLALQWVPASTASILIYTTPLWLVILDICIFKNSVELRRVVLTIFSALGCLIVLGGASQAGSQVSILLILLASIFWSISMRLIAAHRWNGGVTDAIFWQCFLAGIIMLPIAWYLEGGFNPFSLTIPGWAIVVYVGPIATGLGFGIMVAIGQTLPVHRIALFSTAAPLIGFLSSAIVLNESLHPMVIIGGAIILLALFIGAMPVRRQP